MPTKTSKVIELPIAEGYDRWAPIYETNGNPLMVLEEQVMRSHFQHSVKGKRILDLGCGTGRHGIWLAQQGARVTGLDASGGMLQMAKDNAAGLNLELLQHDLSTAFPLEKEAFDEAVSTLVLEHIPDLPFFFREIWRVVKPEGAIYISAMHPAMMRKGNQANFTDPETGEEVRPRGFPHQLSEMIRAMLKAGLRLIDMREYFCTADLIRHFPKAAKYRDWPMLVVFQLKPTR